MIKIEDVKISKNIVDVKEVITIEVFATEVMAIWGDTKNSKWQDFKNKTWDMIKRKIF